MAISKAECKRVALETFLAIAKNGTDENARLNAAQSLYFYAVPPPVYGGPPMPYLGGGPSAPDDADEEV
jgi:hypothetical protein